MITQERLKEVLYYHLESGDFIWLEDRGTVRAGTQAGTLDEKGYIRIKIDGKKVRAHRLAWRYVTGEIPPEQLDHRDRIRHHNAWANIRDADGTQQNANKNIQINNISGIRGVSFWNGKWRAVIHKTGKQKFLGYFDSKDAAALVYYEAAQQYFGDFVRAEP